MRELEATEPCVVISAMRVGGYVRLHRDSVIKSCTVYVSNILFTTRVVW